ncbi:spermidine/putrescine ABC transporter substrate-binding protein [Neiella sp. HB171785]|uniref:Spermidine/putrescine ABC transporter substrate-binding protein n=1 Tax=Neiella litorisoli TaxID=2771431 RepID=A0A8J6UI51_9GAMM|nr:spermidine/putrescine ABC transporter substrate-binding protein [Neiella litorisoli]MBD1388098.1 spermidine/putrescine ABC transporter substrate-binding protein [Neiella litorisoli]
MKVSPYLAMLACGINFYAAAATVELYIWEEYLAPEVIEAFTEESGHTVHQTYFNDEDVRDGVITSGRAKAYDLIMINGASLRQLASHNYLKSLATTTANYQGHYDQRWLELCSTHGLPYSWGTLGIVYRESVSATPITSWRQLFEPPPEHSGHIAMYMDTIDTVGSALLALQQDPLTGDQQALKQAYELLIAQRTHVKAYQYGYDYTLQHKQDSDITMSLGYSDDQYVMAEATGQQDWVYTVPKEGTLLWAECLAAPAEKPLSEATIAFLEFISRPDIAALNAESLWFSTPNKAALALTSAEYQQDTNLFPAAALMKNSRTYRSLEPDAMNTRSRIMAFLENQ